MVPVCEGDSFQSVLSVSRSLKDSASVLECHGLQKKENLLRIWRGKQELGSVQVKVSPVFCFDTVEDITAFLPASTQYSLEGDLTIPRNWGRSPNRIEESFVLQAGPAECQDKTESDARLLPAELCRHIAFTDARRPICCHPKARPATFLRKAVPCVLQRIFFYSDQIR